PQLGCMLLPPDRAHRRLHSFPTRRSSDLGIDLIKDDHSLADQTTAPFRERVERCQEAVARANDEAGGNALYFPNVTSGPVGMLEDRKSTRLNSSHVANSYAVFCLKKKNNT